MARRSVDNINVKSTLLMAQKFDKEFAQVTHLLTKKGKQTNIKSDCQVSDVFDIQLTENEVISILFCIGFSKSMDTN